MHSILLQSALVLGGALFGLGLGLRLARRYGQFDVVEVVSEADPGLGPIDVDPVIRDAAWRWATARGRPEAAGIVADKLRTLYRINHDRPVVRPRRRWWS